MIHEWQNYFLVKLESSCYPRDSKCSKCLVQRVTLAREHNYSITCPVDKRDELAYNGDDTETWSEVEE